MSRDSFDDKTRILHSRQTNADVDNAGFREIPPDDRTRILKQHERVFNSSSDEQTQLLERLNTAHQTSQEEPATTYVPHDIRKADAARAALDARKEFETRSYHYTVAPAKPKRRGGAPQGAQRFSQAPQEALDKKAFKKQTRFLKWFRVLPLLFMFFALVASIVFTRIPATIMRTFFYPVHYEQIITEQAGRYNINPYLVCAVIRCESNWDANAQSSAGAQGLMQVMPETAKELARAGKVDSSQYSASNLFDPATNIAYGCAYLSQLFSYADSTDEAIAAYNAGPNVASDWADALLGQKDLSLQDVIKYPETKLYLQRVKDARSAYERYYPNGIAASSTTQKK